MEQRETRQQGTGRRATEPTAADGPGDGGLGDGGLGDGGPGADGALPPFAERVLDLAERIPPGTVMTYGDVAEFLEQGGPRQVGRVMALYGGAVPWWRVVRADGAFLPGHERRALARYREEGTPLRTSRTGAPQRVDMARARWDGA
ncbi:MGMT family protein [Streptacidiphilus sp. ASG 303]|uniref:MGMT family protein n=1 Tax=Streptacidiphilus sp. ASG 303 TaxID=2896847 RepID=UPI001E310F79|nr:MGMT family protein [Streptacidiphilus sp. ASG 303]MCD0482810.1 MGMT family protein [Streptacidiphilus sp. ASG 303]